MPCQRSRKHKERNRLELLVINCSLVMPSCSFCERNKRKCVVAEGSTRCSECIGCARSCDVYRPSVGAMDAVLREYEKLDREEEEARESVRKGLAKVERLNQLRRSLCTRAADMICRGVQSLDELDAVEENKRREAEACEQELALAAIIADLESAQAIDESAVLLPPSF